MFVEAHFDAALAKVQAWPIWDKFTVVESGCWEWTAAILATGYGAVAVGGHARKAHRVVYELLVGPIPAGLHIDHLCCNRRCVNPLHLEPVTPRENNRRIGLRRTHCPQGHEYTASNTMIARGVRNCKACRSLQRRGLFVAKFPRKKRLK